MADTNTHG